MNIITTLLYEKIESEKKQTTNGIPRSTSELCLRNGLEEDDELVALFDTHSSSTVGDSR